MADSSVDCPRDPAVMVRPAARARVTPLAHHVTLSLHLIALQHVILPLIETSMFKSASLSSGHCSTINTGEE
jgi:hypothetical protein